MKKILLFIAATTFVTGLGAQPWIEASDKPQKLSDIIAAYERKKAASDDGDGEISSDGKIRKEGKDYHFGRWVWYWQNHLDEDGYMVSPMRTFSEWRKYQANKSQRNARSKTTNTSQWTFNGPTQHLGGNNGLGRVNIIEFHPTDSNVYIVGTAGGGAWRTDNDGQNWTSLYDNLPVLGVSDIDYNPLNPQTIYLSTGDKNAGDTYSVGILKSTDGGITWDTTGLMFTPSDMRFTNTLLINPLDTNSLTAATSIGIFKSFDGGTTWASTIAGHFKQIVYNPADTNILYGATYVTGGAQIYRSADGGFTWTASTNITGSRRIELAVTPANPSIVKAVVSNTNHGLEGIYSSSDTGQTFIKVFGSSQDCSTNILNGSTNPNSNSCTGQGWYDLSIAASPIDQNKLVVGGINTWMSLDGGASWSIINQAYGNAPGIMRVHADKHYHAFHPLSPTTLFECNDGGVVKASGNHTLWNNLSNGLAITQFYRLATSDIANFVIAGAQDNGTKRMNFDQTSSHVTGGDGMDCQMSPVSSSIYYTSSQYGVLYKVNNSFPSNISNNIPGDPTGAWITPFILHPNDPSTIFAGYSHLYMSNNQGSSWIDISPKFSTAGTLMRRIAMTPQDDDRIFVAVGDYTIRYTFDLGTNWTTIPGSGNSGLPISDIQVNPTDKNHLLVTYSGYNSSSSQTHVAEYRIGVGWKKIGDSLPNVPVHCMIIDSSNGTMYIGTDVGVFYRDHTMAQWEEYNSGLPTIEVSDLSINYATNEVWASTYGRGVWKSPRHIAVPNGISNVPYALDVISIAPNPNSGKFTIMTTNKSLVDQQTSVRIMSYMGALVMQTEGRFDSGGNLSINSGNLARGTYIVEVNKNGMVYARSKMVIM